jgi:hypothetical protein
VIPSRIEGRVSGSSELAFAREEWTLVPIVRGGAALGYDFGRWRLFAGVAGRNHPTNLRSTVETVMDPEDIHADVGFGPGYLLVGVGTEVDLVEQVSLLLQVYEPLGFRGGDVIYAPIAGLTVDIHAAP